MKKRRGFTLIELLVVIAIIALSRLESSIQVGLAAQRANASNWNPAIVPDNRWGRIFNVTIDSNSIGTDKVLIGLEQSLTINQLACYGSVELQKWTQDWVELWLQDVNGLRNHGFNISRQAKRGKSLKNSRARAASSASLPQPPSEFLTFKSHKAASEACRVTLTPIKISLWCGELLSKLMLKMMMFPSLPMAPA